MSEIIEEVKSFLKEGQRIVVNCEQSLSNFESDARILRNIMFNLISNASKYSETHKKISLTCFMENGAIIFGVHDEGIGIPEQDQKHLFDRFFRASNAGNVQGTGLGLNIVKRYADLLKGNLTFESEFGKGSTFFISIPNN